MATFAVNKQPPCFCKEGCCWGKVPFKNYAVWTEDFLVWPEFAKPIFFEHLSSSPSLCRWRPLNQPPGSQGELTKTWSTSIPPEKISNWHCELVRFSPSLSTRYSIGIECLETDPLPDPDRLNFRCDGPIVMPYESGAPSTFIRAIGCPRWICDQEGLDNWKQVNP